MRHKGRITNWNDARGFGFVTPVAGGDQVFVHIKSFRSSQRRPVDREFVTYELKRDPKGRLQGVNILYSGEQATAAQSSPRVWKTLLVPSLFFVGLATGVARQALPAPVLWIYLAASAVTFVTYAMDKSAAKSNQWRTSEGTLLTFGLFGGWPGALVAQGMLRHKSRKQSFRLAFWITVAINIAVLVWVAFNVDLFAP
jgi:uncharacterized membrane protein YsdA (DUF1294 family)/cold shock CspA family protein